VIALKKNRIRIVAVLASLAGFLLTAGASFTSR
jgi:hypothetical protein